MAEKVTKKSTKKTSDKMIDRSIIVEPRITEKAALGSGENVYIFNVTPKANKTEIKKVIKDLYGVSPVRVNILNLPYKKVKRGKTEGKKGGGKKAMIFLKKGDSIQLV